MASRADIEAGAAFIRMYMKSAELVVGMKDAGNLLDSFARRALGLRGIISSLGLPQFANLLNRVGDAAKNAGKSLLQMGLVAGGALAVPIAQFANFDDAMREVRAVSTGTESQFQRLTEVAKQLGASTSFSAVQVANLMTELGRAGFTTDQIESMTGAVLDLSRASGTNATTSAGIMAASIRQFGLGATDAARVSDALTAAANKSFSSVEGLGEALSYAGPVAADFGVSIEEALAIIGGLGNVGIQGSEAGTALRRLLTLTGAEAKKLQGIFGVAFVDSAGNARPLIDTMAEVNDATAKLGTAARSSKFNEAFGLLGITAASAIGKTQVDIRQLLKDIQAAGGGARKAAEDMDAGLGGGLRRLMAAVNAVGIAIGEALGEELLKISVKIKNAVNSIGEFVKNNKGLIVTLAKSIVAVTALGGALIAIGAALSPIAAVFSILGSLASVIVPIVSAMGLLVSIFGAGPILAFIGSIASAIGSMITFGGVIATLTTIGSFLAPILGTAAAVIGGIIAVTVGAAAAATAAAVAFWKLADPFTALMPMLRSVMDGVSEFTSKLFSGDFQGAANAAIEGMKQVFLRGTMAIMQMVQNSLTRLPGFINSVLSGTGGIVSAAIATIQKAFTELWPAIKLSFTAFVSFAKDVFDQLPAIAGYAIGRLFRAVIDGITKMHEWLARALIKIVPALLNALAGLGPKLIKAMLTGNMASLTKDISRALAAAGGLAAGITLGDAPEFKPSAGTIAAWEQFGDQVKSVTKTATSQQTGGAFGGGGKSSVGGSGSPAGVAMPADAPKWLDSTPIEEYREKLKELLAADLSPEKLAAGLTQLKNETLGIEPGPLQQFRDRLLTLNEALKSGIIDGSKWRQEIAKAQKEILGVEPTRLQQLSAKIRELSEQMQSGAFGFDEYMKRLRKARADILGVDPTPLQKLADKVEKLSEQFQAGAFGKGPAAFAEYSKRIEEARRETAGLDSKPIETFVNRITELRKLPLKPGEFAAEFKEAQATFLGFDPHPLETFTARVNELRYALSQGLIKDKNAFNLAVLNALPQKIKDIVEKTKSPLEKQKDLLRKYREDMAALNAAKASGAIKDNAQLQRAQKELGKSLFADVTKAALGDKATSAISSSGTFSAAGAQGLGIGGINDKALKAQLDANVLLGDIRSDLRKRPRFK